MSSKPVLGIHYDKNGDPIKMIAFFEKSNRAERVEFKMENKKWVQSDRVFSNNNNNNTNN
jgi:hypothetical protein